MTDLSQMSDDDLLALYQQEKAKVAAPKAKGPPAQDMVELNKLREAARGALGTAIDAGKFVNLNRQNATGAFPGMLAPVLAALNPTYAQMKALAARNGPSMRPPGSGSSSDKDMKLYLSGFPSIANPGEANAGIAKDLRDNSDRAAAMAAFADTWMQKRGSLNGMQGAFDQFWAKRQAGDPVANNVAPAPAPVAAAPQGVDPAIWAHMTPQERALWH